MSMSIYEKNALDILATVDDKRVNFDWAVIQLLGAIVMALLHIADVIREK